MHAEGILANHKIFRQVRTEEKADYNLSVRRSHSGRRARSENCKRSYIKLVWRAPSLIPAAIPKMAHLEKRTKNRLVWKAAIEPTNHYSADLLRRTTPTELLKAERQHQC